MALIPISYSSYEQRKARDKQEEIDRVKMENDDQNHAISRPESKSYHFHNKHHTNCITDNNENNQNQSDTVFNTVVGDHHVRASLCPRILDSDRNRNQWEDAINSRITRKTCSFETGRSKILPSYISTRARRRHCSQYDSCSSSCSSSTNTTASASSDTTSNYYDSEKQQRMFYSQTSLQTTCSVDKIDFKMEREQCSSSDMFVHSKSYSMDMSQAQTNCSYDRDGYDNNTIITSLANVVDESDIVSQSTIDISNNEQQEGHSSQLQHVPMQWDEYKNENRLSSDSNNSRNIHSSTEQIAKFLLRPDVTRTQQINCIRTVLSMWKQENLLEQDGQVPNLHVVFSPKKIDSMKEDDHSKQSETHTNYHHGDYSDDNDDDWLEHVVEFCTASERPMSKTSETNSSTSSVTTTTALVVTEKEVDLLPSLAVPTEHFSNMKEMTITSPITSKLRNQQSRPISQRQFIDNNQQCSSEESFIHQKHYQPSTDLVQKFEHIPILWEIRALCKFMLLKQCTAEQQFESYDNDLFAKKQLQKKSSHANEVKATISPSRNDNGKETRHKALPDHKCQIHSTLSLEGDCRTNCAGVGDENISTKASVLSGSAFKIFKDTRLALHVSNGIKLINQHLEQGQQQERQHEQQHYPQHTCSKIRKSSSDVMLGSGLERNKNWVNKISDLLPSVTKLGSRFQTTTTITCQDDVDEGENRSDKQEFCKPHNMSTLPSHEEQDPHGLWGQILQETYEAGVTDVQLLWSLATLRNTILSRRLKNSRDNVTNSVGCNDTAVSAITWDYQYDESVHYVATFLMSESNSELLKLACVRAVLVLPIRCTTEKRANIPSIPLLFRDYTNSAMATVSTSVLHDVLAFFLNESVECQDQCLSSRAIEATSRIKAVVTEYQDDNDDEVILMLLWEVRAIIGSNRKKYQDQHMQEHQQQHKQQDHDEKDQQQQEHDEKDQQQQSMRQQAMDDEQCQSSTTMSKTTAKKKRRRMTISSSTCIRVTDCITSGAIMLERGINSTTNVLTSTIDAAGDFVVKNTHSQSSHQQQQIPHRQQVTKVDESSLSTSSVSYHVGNQFEGSEVKANIVCNDFVSKAHKETCDDHPAAVATRSYTSKARRISDHTRAAAASAVSKFRDVSNSGMNLLTKTVLDSLDVSNARRSRRCSRSRRHTLPGYPLSSDGRHMVDSFDRSDEKSNDKDCNEEDLDDEDDDVSLLSCSSSSFTLFSATKHVGLATLCATVLVGDAVSHSVGTVAQYGMYVVADVIEHKYGTAAGQIIRDVSDTIRNVMHTVRHLSFLTAPIRFGTGKGVAKMIVHDAGRYHRNDMYQYIASTTSLATTCTPRQQYQSIVRTSVAESIAQVSSPSTDRKSTTSINSEALSESGLEFCRNRNPLPTNSFKSTEVVKDDVGEDNDDNDQRQLHHIGNRNENTIGTCYSCASTSNIACTLIHKPVEDNKNLIDVKYDYDVEDYKNPAIIDYGCDENDNDKNLSAIERTVVAQRFRKNTNEAFPLNNYNAKVKNNAKFNYSILTPLLWKMREHKLVNNDDETASETDVSSCCYSDIRSHDHTSRIQFKCEERLYSCIDQSP